MLLVPGTSSRPDLDAGAPATGPSVRLQQVLAQLRDVARARPIRVCCVDLPLPECPWLTLTAAPSGEVTIYQSAPPSLARLEPSQPHLGARQRWGEDTTDEMCFAYIYATP